METMIALKLGLEMDSFSSYDFLCAFHCALKFLFFAFASYLKTASY